MKELVLATANDHKVRELKQLLDGKGWEILSLRDFPDVVLPPEDGATFEANAVIKAQAVQKATGKTAMADDSGLEVDYLGGAPGIFSARFAGENKDSAANNAKLLSLLAGVGEERRGAAFTCVIALAFPDGRLHTSVGHCPGRIAFQAAGEGGFGYDPIFYLPEYDRSMAQLSSEEKNSISHRSRALAGILPILAAELG